MVRGGLLLGFTKEGKKSTGGGDIEEAILRKKPLKKSRRIVPEAKEPQGGGDVEQII